MSKNIFISGGSRGIGRAIVAKFSAEGYCTYFCDLLEPDWDLDPQKQFFFKCDISDRKAVDQLAKKLVQVKFKNLVNNAGINLKASIRDITYDEWDRVLKVNVYGTFLITKALLENLDLKDQPSIVNLGSDQSIIAKANKVAYATSKGAILQFSKSLAVDLGVDGIRVNCVCPGPIDTPMLRNLVGNKKLELAQPINRLGKPEEVAELVYFLCSDQASYITGAAYLADGGFTAQ